MVPLDLSKLTGKKISSDVHHNLATHNKISWEKHFAFIPLTKNEEVAPGVKNSVFDRWHVEGVRRLQDVYQGDTLMSAAATKIWLLFCQKVKNLPTDTFLEIQIYFYWTERTQDIFFLIVIRCSDLSKVIQKKMTAMMQKPLTKPRLCVTKRDPLIPQNQTSPLSFKGKRTVGTNVHEWKAPTVCLREQGQPLWGPPPRRFRTLYQHVPLYLF